jgi:hypothetical protein
MIKNCPRSSQIKLTIDEIVVEITLLELGIILIQVYDFSQILLFLKKLGKTILGIKILIVKFEINILKQIKINYNNTI